MKSKICKVCNKEYTKPTKYCSQICYWKTLEGKQAWNKGIKYLQTTGKNHWRWKGDRKKCLVCLKTIYNRRGIYCSNPCYASTLRGKQPEHLKSLCFKKGQTSWNKGKKLVMIWNHNHPAWKGDNVGMDALHSWVKRRLGRPDTCEFCGKSGLKGRQIQWANKSHGYKRDVSDWLRLCTPCHSKYDRTNREDIFNSI